MKDVKRVVSTSFWDDNKVTERFSVEDRYFMLYLLTNPHTTQLGIYGLPITRAANETGYSKEVIVVLLERFEKNYGIIKYSHETGEVAIKNYLRHSIVKGGKPVMDCLIKEERKVKDKSLLAYIYDNLIQYVGSENINATVEEFINNLTLEEEKEKPIEKPEKDELVKNFETIYASYPKKVGRTRAFKLYVDWVTKGRKVNGKIIKLNNKQIWLAIRKYKLFLEKSDTELQFYKNFDTFMGNSILDYVEGL